MELNEHRTGPAGSGTVYSLTLTDREQMLLGPNGLARVSEFFKQIGDYVVISIQRDAAPYDADATAVDEPPALPDGHPGGFPSDRLVAGYLNAPPPGGDDE